jgi:Zn-dependent protease with chaperone function
MDVDDVQALAAILENERRSHCQKRAVCLGMFVFSLVSLILALGIVVLFLVHSNAAGGLGQVPIYSQLLTALSAAVVGFFSMWWSAQNCINSIERTLYAARAGRHRLFVSFVEQLQCTDKKKRRVWLEIVSSAVM